MKKKKKEINSLQNKKGYRHTKNGLNKTLIHRRLLVDKVQKLNQETFPIINKRKITPLPLICH